MPCSRIFRKSGFSENHFSSVCILLLRCLSGIPAAGYKYIQYFDGTRKAYEDFVDMHVDIGDIGVESFEISRRNL